MKYILSLFAAAAVVLNLSALELIKGGKTDAVIVIADNKNDVQRTAAAELSMFLEKRTGAKIPVIKADAPVPTGKIPVYLGISDKTVKLGLDTEKLEYDGYFLKVSDKYIIIAGNDKPMTTEPVCGQTFIYNNFKLGMHMFGEQGTLHGVYKFLEKYAGIRFYMPGDLGTIIPKSPDFSVPSVETYVKPSFKKRAFYAFWFSRADNDAIYWHHRLCAGGMRNPTNHNFRNMQKYKDTNPEYFALIDGKRDFSNLSTANNFGNLCLTNRGAIETFARHAGNFYDRSPYLDIYACVPQDGMYRICECENCKKLYSPHLGENGKFSNAVFHFASEVAKIVKKTHPGKKIGVLAYERYRVAPEIELPDNMIVMICYTRQGLANPAVKKEVEQAIASYHAKKVPITVWTYPLFNHIPPLRGIPIFYPGILKENMMYNVKNGVIGEFAESGYRAGGGDQLVSKTTIALPGLTHLNDYVRCQLLWDAELDVDALFDEYCRLFYGPAAAEMKKFWRTAEEKFLQRREATVYTSEDIKTFQAMLKTALAKTSNNSDYYKRIKMIIDESAPFFKTMLLVRSSSNSLGVPLVKGDIPETYDPNSVWKFAGEHTFVFKGGNSVPAHQRTKLYSLANEKGLALHLVANESNIAKMVKKAKKNDDGCSWLDDCYEIFLSTRDRDQNYQIIITAGGFVFDRKLFRDVNVSDRSWNSKLKFKQSQRGKQLLTTLFIPWEDFGKTLDTMPEFLIQIFRRQTNGNPKSGVYQVTFPSLGFHNYSPEYFGAVNILAKSQKPTNAGFEKASAKKTPLGWTGGGEIITGDAAEGKNSVALVGSSIYSTPIPVTEDVNYALFVKHKKTAGYIYVSFYDINGKGVAEPNRPFFWAPPSKDWQLVKCLGKVPAGAVSAKIILRNFAGKNKTPSCYDDVMFFGGSSFKGRKNLLSNASFEKLDAKGKPVGWINGCKILTDGAADGEKYVRVAIKEGDFVLSPKIMLKDYKRFIVEGVARGDSGYVYMMYYNAQGKLFKSSFWGVGPYEIWSDFLISGQIPDGAVFCRIGLRNFAVHKVKKTGTLFDNLKFYAEK